MFEIYAIMETMISFSLKIGGDWINGWRKKKKNPCVGECPLNISKRQSDYGSDFSKAQGAILRGNP